MACSTLPQARFGSGAERRIQCSSSDLTCSAAAGEAALPQQASSLAGVRSSRFARCGCRKSLLLSPSLASNGPTIAARSVLAGARDGSSRWL